MEPARGIFKGPGSWILRARKGAEYKLKLEAAGNIKALGPGLTINGRVGKCLNAA